MDFAARCEAAVLGMLMFSGCNPDIALKVVLAAGHPVRHGEAEAGHHPATLC